MDVHMTFSGTMGYGHQHRPQLQEGFRSRHYHGIRWQFKTYTSASTWPLAAAWPTDFNMASGRGMEHGHEYALGSNTNLG